MVLVWLRKTRKALMGDLNIREENRRHCSEGEGKEACFTLVPRP